MYQFDIIVSTNGKHTNNKVIKQMEQFYAADQIPQLELFNTKSEIVDGFVKIVFDDDHHIYYFSRNILPRLEHAENQDRDMFLKLNCRLLYATVVIDMKSNRIIKSRISIESVFDTYFK